MTDELKFGLIIAGFLLFAAFGLYYVLAELAMDDENNGMTQ